MIELDSLNPEQKRAVCKIHGSLMILAGAGTGKTRVITYRIAHMLQSGIQSREIVALTFTNKAAKEMQERLISLAGQNAKYVTVSTFHSFCLKMIRTYSPQEDGASYSLIGATEQLDIVRRGLEEKGWSGLYKAQDILNHISHAKNNLLRPKDLLGPAAEMLGLPTSDLNVLCAVYPLYERLLKLNRVMDFDDCLFKFIELLREHDEIRLKLEKKLRYFLVDEFQDTNMVQLEALRLVAENSQNVCVVGDDDQSIYSWRGADPRILERFETLFPKTELIKLEQNYRCTGTILNAANTVIRNNKHRKDKSLWSNVPGSELIAMSQHANETEEADWTAKACFGLLGKGHHLNDIAILYRTNGQARALEIALREANLNYKVYGGQSFFEKKEVKDFLCYFKLTITPWDRFSFWRIINTPPRGIGLKTQELIEEEAKKDDLSPMEAALRICDTFKKSAHDGILHLSSEIKKLSKTPLNTPEDIKQRAQAVLKAFQLEEDIRLRSSPNSRSKKIDSLNSLPKWLESIAGRFENDDGLNVREMIDHLTLSDESKQKGEKEEAPAISLMTIHSSKGLEFPFVFINGIEEELLPHKNSESPSEIDEERRLLYVAITRAKKKLFLSFSRQRITGFTTSTRKPSRFIAELPSQDIEMLNQITETKPEEKQSRNIRRLGSLREKIRSGFS